jgi:hypothetical protein
MSSYEKIKDFATPIVNAAAPYADDAFDSYIEVMKPVVAARKASGIPLRRREAPMLRDRNGNKFVKTIPYDLDRRYDEASFNVYERRVRLGYKIPRAGLGEVDECLDNSFTGTALGMAYGLQYDRNQKGVCFDNIETFIEALDSIMSMFYLVFLPFEWADLGLAVKDFVDVGSSLYAKCQM